MSRPKRVTEIYGQAIKKWLEETKPPKDPSNAAMQWQMNQFLASQMPLAGSSDSTWGQHAVIFPMYYQSYCGIPLVKVPDGV